MRIVPVLIAACLLLAAAAIAASAAPPATLNDDPVVHKILQDKYDRLMAAQKSLNFAQFSKVLTSITAPNFVAKPDPGKQLNLAAFLAASKQSWPMTKSISVNAFKITALNVIGATAVDKSLHTISGTIRDIAGKIGPKGKIHKVTGQSVYVDEWVKIGGDWKLQTQEVVYNREFIDGKLPGAATAGK